MHKYNPSIFREYDIRGIVGKTLQYEDAYHIGLAYAATLKNGKIAVGYDGRTSSPLLAEQLIKGLIEGGINVIDIGTVPTPLTYFAVFNLDLDGSIMITGSHNPKEHNGFKIMLGKDSIYGDAIKKLSQVMGDKSETVGKIEIKNLKAEYLKKITYDIKPTTYNYKIGWDPGNGAAGEVVSLLTEKLPGKHFLINEKIDGNFPTHHPDPSDAKNLQQLIELVRKENLDVGFAFDGDGDRIGVIDNKGRIIWGDQILAILSRDVLAKHPGAPIIADVKTSRAVFDYITKQGGKAVMWKTGHSLVKAKMKELKAPLAGEMSAHIFFADEYYGYDDGIYAALRFLRVMQNSGRTAAELFDELPKMFSSPEMRIECDEALKFQIIDKVKNKIAALKANFSDIDGVRVNENGGWWLLRASNTSNHLVARAEANSEENLNILKEKLKNYLKDAGVNY